MPEMPEHLPRQVQENWDQIEGLRFALRDFAYLMMTAADVPNERQLQIADMLRRMPPSDAESAVRSEIAFELRCVWADTIEQLILK